MPKAKKAPCHSPPTKPFHIAIQGYLGKVAD
jgi:hypothetical protein